MELAGLVVDPIHTWTASTDEAGLTLVKFISLKLHTGYSLRFLKKAVEANGCRVNGAVERHASRRLLPGDRVEFESVQTGAQSDAVILYEDDSLVAFDKPTGVSSDGPRGLVSQVGLKLVHRLDKETTGVLLMAKTESAKHALEKQFRQRIVKKTYLALVDGVPVESQGTVKNYLAPIHEYQGQKLMGAVSSSEGLKAETNWHVLRVGREAALVECSPRTGRTHQIRVHLAHVGYPVFGDPIYGGRAQTGGDSPRVSAAGQVDVEFDQAAGAACS